MSLVYILSMNIIQMFLQFLQKNAKTFATNTSDHGGADVVLEVAGAESTFRLHGNVQEQMRL